MMIFLTFTGVLLYNVNIRPNNFLTTLYSLKLYMENSADISAFVDKLNDEYTVSVSNASKETESMQMMYSSLITVVAIVLFIITVLIILLILYVIMHSMITDLKTDFGNYKAMGFTSGQLITKTVGSITPVVLSESVFILQPLRIFRQYCDKIRLTNRELYGIITIAIL